MQSVSSKSPNRKRSPGISNDQGPNRLYSKVPKQRVISQLYGSIKGIYTYSTTDVNFIFNINGQQELIPSHKCILANRSPVFRQMFYGEEFLEKNGDVTIVDATIDEFVLFIRSFYEDRLEITEANIHGLAYLADKYIAAACEEVCKHFLNEILDKNEMLDAIFWVLPLASQYNYMPLRQKCIRKVTISGVLLMLCSEFVNCSQEALLEILRIDFFGREENKVFERCIAWAKHACEKEQLDPESPENLRIQLGDCFKLIRFHSMSSREFVQCLSVHVKMFTIDEIEQISKVIAGRLRASDLSKYFRIPSISAPIPQVSAPIPQASTNKAAGVYECNTSLATMFDDNATTDVFFTFAGAGNQQLAGHKCVLAAKSHTFEKLFIDLDQTNKIHILDSSLQEFSVFLKSFYTKPSIDNLTKEFVDQVLALSVKFGATELHLEDSLLDALNDANVFWMLELSQNFKLGHLYSVSCDHIKSGGIEILSTTGFLNAHREILKIIPFLHDEATCVDSLLICNAFMKWAEAFCDRNNMDKSDGNLRTAFGDAFESIPFVNMRLIDFAFFQHKYDGMFSNEDVRKIMNEFTKKSSNRVNAHSTLVEDNDNN
ncbi:uncharacterized protein LOC129570674 [Sitodiplosis mosellana]|uniref:uncharacterized protein LOC129570674 n=1 Tax=Sitodiplosis mosellana TaxID=263140 RepID=UPI00244427E9|nr:uncharacterized protein LOC129570674 [Sitodiplosis mosellana]XP_055306344.1 uncharacterized protein LOC129570674 [Sitodiplosis mosellana]